MQAVRIVTLLGERGIDPLDFAETVDMELALVLNSYLPRPAFEQLLSRYRLEVGFRDS